MSVRRIGQSWYADVTWNGKRYRKRSPQNTKQGARELEVLISKTLARDGNLDALDPKKQREEADSPPPRFGEFAERWMTLSCEPRDKPSGLATKRSHLRNHLLPTLGQVRLDEITAAQIARLASQLRQSGLTGKTVNNILSTLSSCLHTASSWGELEDLPIVGRCRTAGPPPARFLHESEVQRLVASAEEPWATAILVAARTGLRAGELAGLDWSDLRRRGQRSFLVVSKSYVRRCLSTTKTNRVRYVMLPNDAGDALRRFGQLASTQDAPIFMWNGERFTYGSAQHYLYKACDTAGMERIGWHVLRHTYASELVQRGATLASVQSLLGHTKVEMTRRYAHLAPEHLETTVALLDPPETIHPRQYTGKQTADRSREPLPTPAGNVGLSHNKAKTAREACGRNMVDRVGFEPEGTASQPIS